MVDRTRTTIPKSPVKKRKFNANQITPELHPPRRKKDISSDVEKLKLEIESLKARLIDIDTESALKVVVGQWIKIRSRCIGNESSSEYLVWKTVSKWMEGK